VRTGVSRTTWSCAAACLEIEPPDHQVSTQLAPWGDDHYCANLLVSVTSCLSVAVHVPPVHVIVLVLVGATWARTLILCESWVKVEGASSHAPMASCVVPSFPCLLLVAAAVVVVSVAATVAPFAALVGALCECCWEGRMCFAFFVIFSILIEQSKSEQCIEQSE
jgi:hypothetical protein